MIDAVGAGKKTRINDTGTVPCAELKSIHRHAHLHLRLKCSSACIYIAFDIRLTCCAMDGKR